MMGVVAAQVRPVGQSEITNTATTSLTLPDRVFTASIVAVGGGGGGSTTTGSGGAGGAGGNLAYKDIASITPGLAYSITIGSAGTAGGTTGGAGGNTQWNASTLVAPGGGGARSGVLGGLAGAANTGATGGALGGVGGALIAAGILAWMIGSRAATPQDAPQFRVIFAIAAFSSSIAFLMTWLIPNTPSIQVEQRKKDFAKSTGVPYGKSFWVAMSAMVLFMLGNSSDTFLLLRALDLGESPVKCVLLYALFNATYTASSYPMGLLSDRYGRWPVLATGWAIYALSYAGFAMLERDTAWIFWGLFGLYGVSVACTEGTARAMIVDYAPKERVASALGLFGFFLGAAVLIASVVAGILWSYGLPSIAFWMGSGFAVAALAILPWVPGRVTPPPVDPVLQGSERLTSDS